MVRPCQTRRISASPTLRVFKPRGIPLGELQVVDLGLDELEALRLADSEGLYQEEAAERMGVSRVTFGRILEKAHGKVAEALLEGKALVIGKGPVQLESAQEGMCPIHGGPRRRGRHCKCPDEKPGREDETGPEASDRASANAARVGPPTEPARRVRRHRCEGDA